MLAKWELYFQVGAMLRLSHTLLDELESCRDATALNSCEVEEIHKQKKIEWDEEGKRALDLEYLENRSV